LKVNGDYNALPPVDNYFKVFEFSKAEPAYRWDGQVQITAWKPERRDFQLRSASGGHFILIEQFLPGWQAALDGQAAPIERWKQAFQSVQVPPGDHTLNFTFRAPGLRLGAVISFLSIVMLALIARPGLKRTT
jgi:uncharacterized membrane protein YfhO